MTDGSGDLDALPMAAPLDDGLDEPSASASASLRQRWPTVLVAVCAAVAALALAVIAVSAWRQAEYAEEQACLSKTYALGELSNVFPVGDGDSDGEEARTDQAVRIAACFGVEAAISEVPNVVGADLAVARARLRNAGFVPRVEEGDPEGRNVVVFAQEPPAGSRLQRGIVVGLRTRNLSPTTTG